MTIISDNDYSSRYDENGNNKTKSKKWITKVIKVLFTCSLINTVIIDIYRILIINIMIIMVKIIISNSS